MAHVRVGEIFLGKPAGADLSNRLEDLCEGAFPPFHEPGSIDAPVSTRSYVHRTAAISMPGPLIAVPTTDESVEACACAIS